ncbi:MAG: histidinol dehydrogenase [Solirubrobacteraceae bacterium]
MKRETFSRERCEQLGASGVAEHVRALVPGVAAVREQVSAIVADVKARGDQALLELTSRYDLRGGGPLPLQVAQAELDAAIVKMPRDVIAGLQVAIANVSEVAAAGVHGDRVVSMRQGHTIALRELPVDSAAVYVPGGRAPYPSTAVMGVVAARAAGVLDVCVISPPGPDGEIAPGVLGACRLLGVQRVYRVGGAQAVAAVAYGTRSIPRADVVVGPGNLYVQEAKRELSDVIGIDAIAGPSDLALVAGADADPRLVALDLLAQAEHGDGSLVVLIASEQETIDAVTREIDAHALDAPGAVLAVVHATSPVQAVEIADRIAPEHMQLIGTDAEALSQRVRHAGCLFVGPCAGTAFGDYVAGSNHILPTGGSARFASGLNARVFTRRMAEVRIPPEAAEMLAAAGAPIARIEGFAFHAASMEARAGERPPAPQIGDNR